MKLNKYIFILLIVSLVIIFGCNKTKEEYMTITGTAQETKDGYYINGALLEYSEVEKYDADYNLSTYSGKELEIVGKQKEVDQECGKYEQCRAGQYEIIYDIQSINVIE